MSVQVSIPGVITRSPILVHLRIRVTNLQPLSLLIPSIQRLLVAHDLFHFSEGPQIWKLFLLPAETFGSFDVKPLIDSSELLTRKKWGEKNSERDCRRVLCFKTMCFG